MSDRFSRLADRYLSTRASLRNVVRHTLVARQLEAHLMEPPAGIVDVGGGAGHQSIPLAREGYEVTILDTSPRMLGEARRRQKTEDEEVQERMRLVEGAGEKAPRILGEASFDAALCHGVLMYLEETQSMIEALAALVRPGGMVSVLTKNALALAMRPALEGRYGDALVALGSDRELGRLGVETRGETVEELTTLFEEAGLEPVRWYGVRVFTDHLGDRPLGPELSKALELEWEASRREPYRSVARLFHLVGHKTDDTQRS